MNTALDTAAALPPELAEGLTQALPGLPRWSRDLPRGGKRRRPAPATGAAAVYLPSCLNTLFAPAEGGPGVMDAFRRLAARADIRLHIPQRVGGLCCGTPWSSKGFTLGYEAMRRRVTGMLADVTVPVVTDAASCTEGFHRFGFPVVDAVAFTADHILPRLTVRHRLPSLALHPTCSSARLGLDDAIRSIAETIADRVVIPDDWQCCAFAGDRGLLHPELTASATRREADAVGKARCAAHASVNRTCELGLTRATGSTYHHLLELLDKGTT
jgi:D-lactate dehydrogenase